MISQSPPLNTAKDGCARERFKETAICVLLVAITFAVFGQTLRHPFIDLDDDDYVYANPMVAKGLTWKGCAWAFRQSHEANWHPLTWLSHMLDCQLYGLEPAGHHLSNVLLHATTAVVLFLAMRSMTRLLWRCAFLAAVFAIHPLRVESVAWVAERKDILSGLFFVLTIGSYIRYTRAPSLARYAVVALSFFLGLMCKPMLVTVPLVLLVLDYWPLRRPFSGVLLLEKLPLLAGSVAAGLVALVAQHGAGAVRTLDTSLRLENSLVSITGYLGQFFWPSGLAVFYPYPHGGIPVPLLLLSVLLLAAISAAAWIGRRSEPALLAGWLWYLIMLLPVIGIIQVGGQAHADRYTYLPQIGIALAVTWLVADWAGKQYCPAAILGTLSGVVLCGLMACAWKQTTYWQSSEALWFHAVDCTENNYVADLSLGAEMARQGKLDKAIEYYSGAVSIKPDYASARNDLGEALRQKGDLDAAVRNFEYALRIKPDFAEAHYDLGLTFRQKGDLDAAIAQYQTALKLNPELPAAHNNLGNALVAKGDVDDAIAHYRKALELNDEYADAHNNLGEALMRKEMLDEAIGQFERGLQLKFDDPRTHFDLGTAFLQQGRQNDAAAEYRAALRFNPDYTEAQLNLGNILAEQGSYRKALTHFQLALKKAPANPTILNSLAWLLATCPETSVRNGPKAVELARKANAAFDEKDPLILHTLAAALAEAGQFDEAKAVIQKAMDRARATGSTAMEERFGRELKRYQAGLPLPEP